MSLENPGKYGPALGFASSEAFNLLRTNIAFSLPKKECAKIIAVTSSCPAEGKSYNSINLSYSIALSGAKTLLVDGDLRKPKIAINLNLENKKGLSNILVDSSLNVTSLIRKSGMTDTLNVITSGPIPPNPSELIGSLQMKSFLETMAADYDYIVLDLPPVNTVSDALSVSAYVDGIVMVVRHNTTHKSDVMEAMRQLNLVQAKILGFVYNGATDISTGYSRYNKHYSRHGYRYYDSYGYKNSYSTDSNKNNSK